MEEIQATKRSIRTLRIQGARNVAAAGLDCLKIAAQKAPAKSAEDLLETMSAVAREVSLIRVTEPMLRNVLASVLVALRDRTELGLPQLRTFAASTCDEQLGIMNASIAKIKEHGAQVIKDGSTIFTHCHSSSVTGLIISESRKKDIRVICTETRPKLQGRRTAKELAESGVEVSLFVDSATHMYMASADLVLIGADAIGGGRLYNKIGSYMVVHFAKEQGIPAYSVCETRKFDPLVGTGYVQPVEQRPESEVIRERVRFKVFNPAFETVPLDMFAGLITEDGIILPREADRVTGMYRHLVPELKKLVGWDDWKEEGI
jgi:ribose 1,5-bisphosphate isomerase